MSLLSTDKYDAPVLTRENELTEHETSDTLTEILLDDSTTWEDEYWDEAIPRQIRLRKANRKPKKSKDEILAKLTAEAAGLERGFRITYKPARFEEQWLLDSLRSFYERGLLADVLAQVKGGKEANVYLCQATEKSGLGLMAAKVYRPRQFRNLSNDAMYREGREILGSSGIQGVQGVVKERADSREMRAMKKKTDFGEKLLHGSWLAHEYNTLGALYKAGAVVPQPIASGDNAMLMQYIGAEGYPAPILQSVGLAAHECEALFNEVMRNVEVLLKMGMIHGDLSAFNILYWQGKITLIDFPQVTMALKNRNAYTIFRRDIQRVCEYFATQGLRRNAELITDQLWQRYVGVKPGLRVDDPVN